MIKIKKIDLTGERFGKLTVITVEECREAVEKQKPKKPKELDAEYGYFICDNCGGAIAYTDDFKSHKYCLNCGQKIDFGGNGR